MICEYTLEQAMACKRETEEQDRQRALHRQRRGHPKSLIMVFLFGFAAGAMTILILQYFITGAL